MDMMGQQGLNIGGISVLFNDVLIDYKNCKVGFRPNQTEDVCAVGLFFKDGVPRQRRFRTPR